MNPTGRAGGDPADGSEFETRVGLRVKGASGFTNITTVAGTDTPMVELFDQAGGDYEFELTLHDNKLAKDYNPIVEPFSVPVGDLNPITNVVVENF